MPRPAALYVASMHPSHLPAATTRPLTGHLAPWRSAGLMPGPCDWVAAGRLMGLWLERTRTLLDSPLSPHGAAVRSSPTPLVLSPPAQLRDAAVDHARECATEVGGYGSAFRSVTVAESAEGGAEEDAAAAAWPLARRIEILLEIGRRLKVRRARTRVWP